MVASGRRIAGAIGSLVNARGLQIGCIMVWHETLVAPVGEFAGSRSVVRRGRDALMP